MKGRRRTTIFRPGLMSNLIIYYKLINYKCMDNIMKCTPLGEQKSLWLRKTLLIMKFFVLFLLLGTIPCWAGVAYSQNVKMSLDMENTTVHDVINAIEKKGEFYFTYNLNQINVNRKVSIKVENKTINQILDRLFSKSGIDYKIENRHIVLYKQAASEVEAVKQQKSINGIVADEQGEPIIGASVLEKGTTNGTITDLDGRFTLSIGKGTELIVSYVGYTTKTVKIGNQSTIKIVLIEDTKTLDEVVVIGYGTQRKGDVTSAISSVKSESFVKGAVTDAGQLIQGKVAGLNISLPSGDPTGNTQIMLRGISSLKGGTSPLVLVDGVPGSLNTVAPEDVESIDVLKDGSATAIYGTRGTNGVIIITTKQSRKEMAPTIDYNGYVSVSNILNRPDFMDADDLRQKWNEGYTFNGANLEDFGADTDWLGELTRTAVSHSHNLSLRGLR
mgnify:CR=1 FL=1